MASDKHLMIIHRLPPLMDHQLSARARQTLSNQFEIMQNDWSFWNAPLPWTRLVYTWQPSERMLWHRNNGPLLAPITLYPIHYTRLMCSPSFLQNGTQLRYFYRNHRIQLVSCCTTTTSSFRQLSNQKSHRLFSPSQQERRETWIN